MSHNMNCEHVNINFENMVSLPSISNEIYANLSAKPLAQP